jgi:hypothetical protein
MGVDAQMVVRLDSAISDEQLIDASYRLAEAVSGHGRQTFWLSNDKDLAKGEIRRALNRVTADDEYRACGVAEFDGRWLWVSLRGRYYGQSYERGDVWAFIAIAEWLERNFPGCLVFYGGDSSASIEVFTASVRQRLIAHWAEKGGRPYYAGEGSRRWVEPQSPLTPTCPLCQRAATQYGSGGSFASWTCDGCSRHWVWIGRDVRAYPPDPNFESFTAAKAQREEPASVDAVDPHVGVSNG